LHVGIGPQGQAARLLHRSVARAEHDHRGVPVLRHASDLPDEIVAVVAGEPQVYDDQERGRFVEKRRLFAQQPQRFAPTEQGCEPERRATVGHRPLYEVNIGGVVLH
jgi:hypothetical protein